MSNSKIRNMSDEEISSAIKTEHKWELKKGVLICFGIQPQSFDWNQFENQNSDPMRVYNVCCHILNGGEHEYRRGQPKLGAATKIHGEEQRFEVLRDVLIKFSYYEWPDFTKRTYNIWKAYRQEKDGPSLSERKKKCIAAVRQLAIAKFQKDKERYLKGAKFPTKLELTNEVAKNLDENENTVHTYCKGVDVTLKWAKENETNEEYQNISRKSA